MKIIRILLPVMAIAFAAACQTVKFTSDVDHRANFGSYKTFAFYNLKTNGNLNELNSERITRFIKAEMAKKGYVEDANSPDLFVNAVTIVKNKKVIQADATGYNDFVRPFGYWTSTGRGSATVHSYEYKNASLIIEVIDSKTRKMIWEGTVNADMEKKPTNPERTFQATVARLMKTFPAKSSDVTNIKAYQQ